MALFKARKKDIDSYETEMSLPTFRIDPNGFIMFDDATLGGACVLEVIPHVHTESITLEDPMFHNESTDFKQNPTYEPSTNALFGNARHSVFPAWVNFLNSLQAQDDSDEPTHIQILAKKCHSDEWYTRIDYACYKAHSELDSIARKFETGKTVSAALKGKRAADYLALLDAIQEKTDNLAPYERDVRNLAGYKTKFFLIISYTPSSEGWWMDGRDSDYYISDHASPFLTFASSQDKIVDKITGIADKISARIAEKNGIQENIGGQEDDFFWIESDRTAQIIATRFHKIMNSIKKWEKDHPGQDMPFHLEKLDGRETAALIRFFPNIMTPYWDKIWTLQSDQNDMLYNFDVITAIELDDYSKLGDQQALFEDIKSGKVDMKHGKDEQEAFLARFKNKDFSEIGDIHTEYKDQFWSPEAEEEEERRREKLAQARSQQDSIWSTFSDDIALEDEYKDQDQKREEFLARYKTRSPGALGEPDKKKKKKALK